MRYTPIVALVGGLLIHERKALEHAPVIKPRILDFEKVVEKTDRLVDTFRETAGVPGLSVSASIGGITVYSKGFGLADVEQSVPASPDTKYRIASISKCFTSLLTVRLLEQGKLNLEENIQSYLPDFVPKTVDGKPGFITVRHLLSHTSGIRHYHKISNIDVSEEKEKDKKRGENTYETSEFLNTKPYDSAQEALEMFRDDALHHLPGEDYTYSTHGYTLISAILESCVARTSPPFDRPLPIIGASKLDKKEDKSGKTPMPEHAKMHSLLTSLFAFLGLRNTQLDYPNTIIQHRTRQYRRDKRGRLILAPWVDNSYKWGGGGILSSAPDLIQLANHLALIYLDEASAAPKVISRDNLVNLLWNPVPGTLQGNWLVGGLYGLGWFVARRSGVPADRECPSYDRLFVGHLGGAVGGTTALLISLPIRPSDESSMPSLEAGRRPFFDTNACASGLPPIAVVILTNLEHASGIGTLAIQLVELLTAELVDYSSKNSDSFQF